MPGGGEEVAASGLAGYRSRATRWVFVAFEPRCLEVARSPRWTGVRSPVESEHRLKIGRKAGFGPYATFDKAVFAPLKRDLTVKLPIAVRQRCRRLNSHQPWPQAERNE